MPRSILPLALIPLLLLSLSGCAALQGFLQPPTARFDRAEFEALDFQKLRVDVVLELTKRRGPCYVLDAIDPRLKDAIAGRCGFYAKVITTGALRPGEFVEVIRVHAQAE